MDAGDPLHDGSRELLLGRGLPLGRRTGTGRRSLFGRCLTLGSSLTSSGQGLDADTGEFLDLLEQFDQLFHRSLPFTGGGPGCDPPPGG